MQLLNFDSKIDCRNVNLKLESTQSHFRALFDNYIWESENQRTNEGIINIWMRNDLYYEGFQTPAGFSSTALSEFVKKNQDRLKFANTPEFVSADSDNLIYFTNNKIGPIIDGYIGEYTSVKKTIKTLSDNNPRNNNIEHGVKQLYDKYEKKNNIWQKTRIPCIEDMMKYGLSWSQCMFNPRKNLPTGNIDLKHIHPRFVLVDPMFNEKYFANSRYRIYRMKIELGEAKRFVKRFGDDLPDKIKALGNDYANTMDSYFDEREIAYRTDYTYIYWIEYKKTYDEDYISSNTMAEYEIEADAVQEEREYYFGALYTPTTGCFFHEINKNSFAPDDYDKFTLTPYYNKFSAVRSHPQSDVEQLCNIQDIINITKTLILDNARQRNLVRMFVKQRLRDTYGDLLEKFIRYGGTLEIDEEEDIKKAVNWFEVPSLPKEVYEFMDITEKSLQDLSLQKEPMKGEYPKDMMSGRAISLLQQQNRRILSYKDININWAATQEAQKMYNIFANEFDNEDIVRVTEGSSNYSSDVVPINCIKSYSEYLEWLTENQIDQAKFEEENEVEIVFKDNEEYMAGHDAEDIMAESLVFINHLSPEDNITMTVTLDFDAERDETEDRAIAIQLFQQGKYPYSMLLDALGGMFAANKDEIIKKLEEEQISEEAKMIATELEKRPELLPQLEQQMAEYDAMMKKQQSAQASGGPTQKQNQAQPTQAA